MSYTILRSGEVTARKEHWCCDLRDYLHDCGVFKWNKEENRNVICYDRDMSDEARHSFQSFIDSRFRIKIGEKHFAQHIVNDDIGIYTYRYPIGIYNAMVELDLFDE